MLRHCLPASIRETLDQLPKSLDDTYLRVLSQIPQVNRAHAHRMLQCLVVAVRPLHVEELAELLAFEFDVAQGDIPKYRPALRLDNQTQAVLSTCSSLVTIISRDPSGRQVVQFSHFSVKEFLVSNRLASSLGDVSQFRICLGSAHTTLTQACLGLLIHSDDHLTETILEHSPLVGYAAKHWVEHARFEDVVSHVHNGLETLFDPDKPHFAAWVDISGIDQEIYGPNDLQRVLNPLYYSAVCGLYDFVGYLATKHPHFVDAVGGNYRFPLLAALARGHIKVAELLLEHGANTDVRGAEGKTILLMALSWLEDHHNLLNTVEFLLTHGADVNARDDTLTSPLHLAEEYGRQQIVTMLLKHNADINSQDNHGQTPLHRLLGSRVYNDHDSNCVRLLMKPGAEVNRRDKDGQTPLLLALEKGRFRAVQVLLEHGADSNVEINYGNFPWHRLSESLIYDEGEMLDHAQFLLKLGVEMDGRDETNTTPLHFAIRRNHLKLVGFLLDHGADPIAENNESFTPMHLLSDHRYQSEGDLLNLALLLLKHGAGVALNKPDKHNETPLLLAIRRDRFKLAETLIRVEYGTDTNAENNKGMTPLHMLSESDSEDEHIIHHLAQVLLKNGADVNRRDKDDETPLHLALRWDRFMLARILLENGADANAENNQGMTPLHILSESDINDEGIILNLVLLLLKNGAEVNRRDRDNETPLQLAIRWDRLMLAGTLLNHGADANAENNKGQTPFHILSQSDIKDDAWDEGDIVDLALLLLKNGAELNKRDKDNETPLHLAIRWGLFKLAGILLKHGADADPENNDGKTPLRILSESCNQDNSDFVNHARLFLELAMQGNRQDGGNKTSSLQVLGIGERKYHFTEIITDPSADTSLENDMGGISVQQVLRGDHGSQERGVGSAQQSLGRSVVFNVQGDNQITQIYLQSSPGPFQIAVLLLYYGANHNIGGEAPIYQETKGEYYIHMTQGLMRV